MIISIDNSTFQNTSSPYVIGEVSDGWHLIIVQAYDEAWNYVSSSTEILIDRSPPTLHSIIINGNANFTIHKIVKLTIYATDNASGLDVMCFSNDGINFTAWEQFKPEKDWILSNGNGLKRVYAKVKDKAGNEAVAISDAILFKKQDKQEQIDFQPLYAGGLILILVLIILVEIFLIFKRNANRK